jgi:pimeloyl-ACP methyl ester carboxylesterase
VARIDISGIGIEYELLGPEGAHAVALVPGGRFSKDADGMHELAQALVAGGKRVLLLDRPNCGASDISFNGENEQALQGRVLTELIRALNLGPTAIGGGSAGSRTTLLAAAHDPEAVSHLLQWWISGGVVALMLLGASYACEPAVTARVGGMEAIAASAAWAEQIKRNPKNRDILLSQDPQAFVAKMQQWAQAFLASDISPVPGMTPDSFKRLTMPVMIVRASPGDIWHPPETSEWVKRLVPHAEVVDAPWDPDSPMRCITGAAQAGKSPFIEWPKLAPQILEFTSRRR